MPARFWRKLPHLGDVGSAQPVLHGTPDRRSDLEQFDEGIGAGKSLSQIGFELRLDAITRGNAALGDDDHLAEPGVRRLQIERQHESRSACSDIGRPMVDAGIPLQLFAFEAGDLRIGLGNRGVLRQVPVDDQFGAVRGRKELLLHELHAEQGKREGRDRHPDGDPAMTHANQKHARRTAAPTRPFPS